MSVATKLEYLNDTKQLLKENINNLGGNLTNEPFRQYASILEGIYESLPKVSGIGASLSLSPSMVGKIKLNEIQGDTLQNGTPTPSSPVSIQSVTGLQNVSISNSDNTDSNTYEVNLGKNLFDKDNITTGKRLYYWQGEVSLIDDANYCVSDYINVNANSTYTINLTMSAYTRMVFYDNNRNPISANETNATFTTPNNTAYVRLSVPLNQLDTTQLEKGQATSYSPYFTPIELNKIGDYKDSIKKSTGKNLFDKDNANIINAIINGTTGDIAAFNTCRTAYIQCKPNTTYAVSRIVGTRFIIGTTTNTPAPGMTCNQYTGNNTASSLTITTGANDNYLLVFYYNSVSDTLTEEQIRNSIMINEGSTALPYEPYGKVWYVEKEYNTVDLGTLTWVQETTASSKRYATTGIQNLVVKPENNSVIVNMLSNLYVKNHASWSWNATSGRGIAVQKNGQLIIYDEDYNTAGQLTNFTTMLTNKSGMLLYPLATPIYEVITNTELIEQLESLYNAKSEDGTTNINVTSEDLSMLLNVGVLKGDAE